MNELFLFEFFVIFAEDTKFGYLGWILVRSTMRIPYPVHRLFLCVPVVLVYAALLPALFIFFFPPLLLYVLGFFPRAARACLLVPQAAGIGARGAEAEQRLPQQSGRRSSGRRQQVRPPSAPRPGQWRSRLRPSAMKAAAVLSVPPPSAVTLVSVVARRALVPAALRGNARRGAALVASAAADGQVRRSARSRRSRALALGYGI